MDPSVRAARFLDADAFLRSDQSAFGNAWRFERVRGSIVAQVAPSPEHGVVLNNLAGEINIRPRGHPECRPELGSGAVMTGTRIARFAMTDFQESLPTAAWYNRGPDKAAQVFDSPLLDRPLLD
jgi:hypothetical protein